ncbi:MAG TPA: catalase family peroxidase [Sphingopyxis sp.]|uniref:catalase family peroxidase n=1 Tax=Sphingopyxis sp. TaxID=1908224 RepID=UPI002E36916C|nr:catalase family peroxidase [Sphingopyxis sp.]HEX2812554.1 catalase family peroxidase [Sphingopyxis sp.]
MPTPHPSLATLTAIAAAPALLLSGFAWASGWVGPSRIGGGTIVDAIEHNAGKHDGYRRAHAKGICVTGYFDASGGAAGLSRARLFAPGRYPVLGRFSTGGSNPFATDGRNVFHALALQLTGPGGQIWRMAMDHTPIFPVATPDAFVALQRASRPDPATGKPDPTAMKAYLARHPETKAYQDYIAAAPLPDSFAGGTYYSINAFRFIDRAGAAHAVRWAFEPDAAFGALDKTKLASLPTDYLFAELRARLAKGPLRWHMTVTVAAPGDVTGDATRIWPTDRQKVEAGTLTLTAAEPEETGACRDITFDPTLLPDGVALSDDPLLPARSAAYSSSFQRRALETPGPSAAGKALAGKGR